MKQKLKSAGSLLLACAVLAGTLALLAQRKKAGPPSLPRLQTGFSDVTALRDPAGPQSVLYQYHDWDCVVAEVTDFRGILEGGLATTPMRQHSEITVLVETPLGAAAPEAGSRLTLYGAPTQERPEAAQGRILLWGRPETYNETGVYYDFAYCNLPDDTLDLEDWLEDGMALDTFSALHDSLSAHLAAQGVSAAGGGALDFLSFALTEEGAFYHDWAKRALEAQLSRGENVGFLLSEYGEISQADLHLATVVGNQAQPASRVTRNPAILNAYREKTGRSVKALLRCSTDALMQAVEKTGSSLPEAVGVAWVNAEVYVPYRNYGTWRTRVLGWTSEPDGTLTVRYQIDRTDPGGLLGAKPRSHTGAAVLRFARPNPRAWDCALDFCENHWD